MHVGGYIGQYRIVHQLGAGGMGAVYVGEHVLLGRRAAIKTLHPTLAVYPEIIERFFTEARATSAIRDHGVVQIFDFGYHVDGTAYIVMELLEGESLQARIERLGVLSPRDALRIARQAAGSLAVAHDRGIIHRDLKPENVYLIADPEAQGGERTKILDFGICKLGVATDAAATQSGAQMGTPIYMSPEQCRGAGRVDQRADIYALGCVLFHMLTGRPPFEGEGAGDYIVAHMHLPPPAPSTLVPGLDGSAVFASAIWATIDVLVARCLAKSPIERFASMRELQAELERVLARLATARPEDMMLFEPAGWRVRSTDRVDTASAVPVTAIGSGGDAWLIDASEATRPDDAAPSEVSMRPRQRATLVVTLIAAVVALAATQLLERGHRADAAHARRDTGVPASVLTRDAGELAPVHPVTPAAASERTAGSSGEVAPAPRTKPTRKPGRHVPNRRSSRHPR